jgi:UDP-glucose 4-epimerase
MFNMANAKKTKKVSILKKTSKKIVLVTGGAGFIGSHLVEALTRDGGYKVYSLDNYFTGSKDNHITGVTYIEGHTKDINKLITVIPEIIFHLGEYSRVEKSFDDLEIVWDFNKVGTFAVLEFCRKHKIKLIYAGSSTKFGDGGMGRDQSPYAWTKASNTELIRNYSSWYGLKYAITYFYNVYGPREISKGPYATVIGIFRECYKEGKPLHVVSPGTQVRNFTHIDDIVDGLVKVGEKGEGDDYGLGSKEGYSILEIAKMFSTNIVMLPERKGNRMNAEVDVFRAEKELKWKAVKSIRTYIQDYTKSYHKRKK